MMDMHRFDSYQAHIPRWITAKFDDGNCTNCGEAIPKGADCLYIPADRKELCGADECGQKAQFDFSLGEFLESLDKYPIIREFLTLGYGWLDTDLMFSYEDQIKGGVYNLGPVDFEAANIEKSLGFYDGFYDLDDEDVNVDEILRAL